MKEYKILTVTPKPFKGREGTEIMYFWYNAQRGDGVQINFGSPYEYTENETVELDLVKQENSQGKIYYKEQAKKF